MRSLILSALIALVVSGCSGAQQAVASPQPRATARAAVSLAKDAWVAAANACDAYAQSKGVDGGQGAVAKSCLSALLPVHDDIVAAADEVDAWDSLGQGNYPCAIQRALSGLASVDSGLSAMGVTVPPALADAVDFIKQVAPACVASSDAGAE